MVSYSPEDFKRLEKIINSQSYSYKRWLQNFLNSQEPQTSRQDMNEIRHIKGVETYIFFYDNQSIAETLMILGRFASNPNLSFTWYDAAVLSQKIRQKKVQLERRFDKFYKE